jgi:hypothetical protein
MTMAAMAASLVLVGVAQAAAPANVTMPSISPAGPVTPNTPLTLTAGTYDASATGVTDTWQRCTGGTCTAISPAPTGNTYTTGSGDVGDTIQVSEVATNSGDSPASTTPETTNAVQVNADTSAPTNTTAPSISPAGPVTTNAATLTLTPGTWSATASTVSDTWERCSAGTCTAISPAPTGNTYTTGSTDAGDTIEVSETASNTAGSPATTTTVTSNAVEVDGNTALPTITGTAQQGAALTYKAGTWTGSPTITYTWDSCSTTTTPACNPVGTASSPSYTPAATDVGNTIEVVETATYASGTQTATSLPTAAVTPPVPVNTAAPSISGAAWEGQTLTASSGTWTNTPTSYTYAWELCNSSGTGCSAISGATTTSGATTANYQIPPSGDAGDTIEVQVTASNAGGASALPEPVSTPTAVITVALQEKAAPTISGATVQGQTLTESHATWNIPVTYSYQWYDWNGVDFTAIPGATGQSYQLTAEDVGSEIEVVETGSTGGGSTPAYSALTGQVTNTAGVVTAASSTALVMSPTSPVAGQSVTLIATVTSGARSVPPSGTLSFTSNGSPIAGCTNLAVNGAGQSITVTCPTTFPASAPRLAAAYTPSRGGLVTASSSPTTTVSIPKAPSSTALLAASHVNLGGRTTYTAQVVPPVSSNGSIVPSGTVTFFDGSKTISGCGNQPAFNGFATCGVKYTKIGNHHISSRYNGDNNFASSSSSTALVNVSPAPPAGYVTAFLSWTFRYHGSYTKLTNFSLTGLSRGITISMACNGQGCPFATHKVYVVQKCAKKRVKGKLKCSTPQSKNLLPAFRGRHLGAGTHLTVTITHPQWLGKYYSFTTRKGNGPKYHLACLAVNSTSPGYGCTGR